MVLFKDKTCCQIYSSGRTVSLTEALEHAYSLKVIILELTGVTSDTIQVEAYTDNKSVQEAIYSAKSIKDNKLLIDVEAIKEMISKKEVEKVQWITGDKMLANALTKRGAASWDLLSAIQKGHLLI